MLQRARAEECEVADNHQAPHAGSDGESHGSPHASDKRSGFTRGPRASGCARHRKVLEGGKHLEDHRCCVEFYILEGLS